MHLIYGAVGTDERDLTALFDTFRNGVGRVFGADAETFFSGGAQAGLCGTGRLVGRARSENSFLMLLGSLHRPLPEWDHAGSPLDDPDRTADFLFRRYRSKGTGFLDGTAGSFVVALWDADARRFLLGADPAGMRTAFYTTAPGGCLAFSSTLYALNCAVREGIEIDRSMEDFLLGYEFLPWQRTLYKDVFSLAPGMLLEWKDGGLRQHAVRPPDFSRYRIERFVVRDAGQEQTGAALFDLFLECVQDMLPGDKSVSVLLGGFDSALVAAACRQLGKEVGTYTFRFTDARCNQAHVEELADQFGLRHRWVDITPDVLRRGLAEYPKVFNVPSAMPHYIIAAAHAFRCMQADGYAHCLTGDGCDDVFLGYPTVFRRAMFFKRLTSLPHWVSGAAGTVLGRAFVENVFGHPVRFARNLITIGCRPMPRRGHISNRILDDHSLRLLRKDHPRQVLDSETILASLAIGLEHMNHMRLAYHGKSMPRLGLTKLSGASAASGLTVFSPFQHPALSALGRSLPDELLRPDKHAKGTPMGKHILMQAVETRRLLPRAIIYQKKASPVAGMADFWYMGPLKEFLLERFRDLPFAYNEKYVRRLLAPKYAEKLFRDRVSLGFYVLTAPALLATYASFNDPDRRGCGKVDT